MLKNCMMSLLALFMAAAVYGHEFDAIRNSEEYLYGEGVGLTYDEADRMALDNLLSQISTSLVSSFSKEYEVNDDVIHERVKSNMRSFSQATLNNAEHKVLKTKNGFEAIRYMKKTELSKVFESRTNKVMQHLDDAVKAEKALKVDDALRNYYWALALLETLPNNGFIKGRGIDGDSVILSVWIPNQMKEVFGKLTIVKGSVSESDCELSFLYDGEPVSSLEFKYFDGVDISNRYGVRDGRCVIELRPGVSSDNIQVYYEYAFENQIHTDREVEMAMKAFSCPVRFPTATVQVQVTDPKAGKRTKKKDKDAGDAIVLESTSSIVCNSIDSVEASGQRQVMETVFQSIRSGNYDASESYFTPEGWETFQSIIHYGNARLFNSMTAADYIFLQYGEKVICRSIPMMFSFKNNTRKFTENVTFTFNADGKIENLAFSLGQDAERDILTKGNWTPQARMAIMNFLEDYKTAFALKDIDYIRSVFDEHAVIIVGKMVRPTADPELKTTLGDNVAEYARLSKEEYMQRLERSFKSNEFINIRFANNDVTKGATEVYGIQIKQDYYSSNYGDTGYLFLIVDLNEPDKPLIKVRTWQPERDPKFGVFSMGDF